MFKFISVLCLFSVVTACGKFVADTSSTAIGAADAANNGSTAFSKLTLTWSDNSTNEDGFRIEKKVDMQDFQEIAVVGTNVTTYKDEGLSSNHMYCYRLRAYNVAGNSGYSNVACAGYDISAKAWLWQGRL